MNTTPRNRVPLWLTALGGVGVAAILAALGFALFVAAQNFARIGV